MKYTNISFCMLLFLVCLFAGACSDNESSVIQLNPENSIVVTIDGQSLTRDQMHRELMNLLITMGPTMSPSLLQAKKQEFELQAIQNLINTQLLVSEARKRGIKILDADVQQQILILQQSYESGDRFRAELYLRELEPRELFIEAERALLVERLMDSVLAAVPLPSEEETREFYEKNRETLFAPEEVKASHILIQVLPDDSKSVREAKRAELNRLRELIIQGADFAETAREFSDCPSKNRGGDLGWFQRGRMAKEFSEAAFSLETGSISEIVETEFGFHLIKVLDHREKHRPELDEIHDDLVRYIRDQRKKNYVQEFIQNLREHAQIDIKPYEGN